MKKLFGLLLCIAVLTGCAQKNQTTTKTNSVPADESSSLINNSSGLSYQSSSQIKNVSSKAVSSIGTSSMPYSSSLKKSIYLTSSDSKKSYKFKNMSEILKLRGITYKQFNDKYGNNDCAARAFTAEGALFYPIQSGMDILFDLNSAKTKSNYTIWGADIFEELDIYKGLSVGLSQKQIKKLLNTDVKIYKDDMNGGYTSFLRFKNEGKNICLVLYYNDTKIVDSIRIILANQNLNEYTLIN